MQINFEAKKLKEANSYVDLLEPTKVEKTTTKESLSLVQRVIKFLFK